MTRPAASQLDTRVATAFYAVVFAIAWAWRSGWQGAPLFFETPADATRGVFWLRDGALGGAAAVVVIGLSNLYTVRFPSGERLSRSLAALIGPLGTPACVLLAVLSGVGEEALFRGALQPVVGWAAASAFFGLAHLAPRRDLLPWSGFAFVVGALLGGLYAYTGALFAPIVTHVLVNAVNLRRLARIAGTPQPTAA